MYLCYPALFQFAPSSFVQPQNNVSSMSQFQPMSQMQAPVVPGQPWLSSGVQTAPVSMPVQQAGQPPSAAAPADNVSAFFTFFFLLFWVEIYSSYLIAFKFC